MGRTCRGRSARRVDHALQRVASCRAVHDAVIATARGSMPPYGVMGQRSGGWCGADSVDAEFLHAEPERVGVKAQLFCGIAGTVDTPIAFAQNFLNVLALNR